MIDLVYKIGSKPEWENHEELKYSLRSVERHLSGFRNVYVIGYKPHWIKNVIHVPNNDPYKSCKDANLINKMILACTLPEVSDQFLNMSDDYIFLRDMDMSYFSIPGYNQSLVDLAKGAQNPNKWQRRLLKTLEQLGSEGKTSFCFEAHMPYLIDKKDYAQILFNYDYGYDSGYCGNTLYFNSKQTFVKSVEGQVLILESRIRNYQQFLSEINSFYLANYTTYALDDTFKRFLSERFSIPSRFEIV